MWRLMFSTTTIESSTRRPIAIVRAARLRMFRVCPPAQRPVIAISSDRGIDTAVTIVARTDSKKTKMMATAITSPSAPLSARPRMESCPLHPGLDHEPERTAFRQTSDGVLDVGGRVEGDEQLAGVAQILGELRECVADRLGDLDRVRLSCRIHHDADRLTSVDPADGTWGLHRFADLGHVGQTHRPGIGVLLRRGRRQTEVAELLDVAELSPHIDGQGVLRV